MGTVMDARRYSLRVRIAAARTNLEKTCIAGDFDKGKQIAEKLEYMRGILKGLKEVKPRNRLTTKTKEELLAGIDGANQVMTRMREINCDYKKYRGNIELIPCAENERQWIDDALKDNAGKVVDHVFNREHLSFIYGLKKAYKKRLEQLLPNHNKVKVLFKDKTYRIIDNGYDDIIMIIPQKRITEDNLNKLYRIGFHWSDFHRAYVKPRTKNTYLQLSRMFGVEMLQILDEKTD